MHLEELMEIAKNVEKKIICLHESATILAMLGLQSERYTNDMDFRDAVDNVLAVTSDYNVMKGVEICCRGSELNEEVIKRGTQNDS